MIEVRLAKDRGTENLGWLDSRHTFSFGRYYDENFMGFGPLRVINEDRVQPGMGFGTHGHRDMEIISYVLEGTIEHKDSLGTGSQIRPGDVQVMSAGTGIRHSEFNPSRTEGLHFLQIWIMPDQEGLAPRYDQKSFLDEEKRGRLRLVASRDGRDGSVLIHQDAAIYVSLLSRAEAVIYAPSNNRLVWLQVARGEVDLNGYTLQAGDGAALAEEQKVIVAGQENDTEVLLFDLPP